MQKTAQLSNWSSIYQKLKNPPAGIHLGNFPSKLPPLNKIVIDPGRLTDNPQAIGYVSTEDTNQDGKLDTIHLSVPRLEEAMRQSGLDINDVKNINSLPPEKLKNVLSVFVEIISHELGHLKDFKPDQQNPFPGGEGVAENAAHNAVQQISLGTTNSFSKIRKSGRKEMDKKTIEVLTSLANKLDEAGAIEIADKVDGMLTAFGYAVDFTGTLEPEIEGLAPSTQKQPVPMGETYQGAPVFQEGKTIIDQRPKPDAPEVRAKASAVRFKEDTGIDAGVGNENIGKIQQALMDLGYGIGAKQVDLDWGPVSSQSYAKFMSDYFDLLKSKHFAPEKIQEQVRYFDSGNLSHLLGVFNVFKQLKGNVSANGAQLWQEWNGMTEPQRNEWKQTNPEKYQALIQYLRDEQALRQKVQDESPLVPEVGGYTITSSTDVKQKIASDVETFKELIRQDKTNPFGR